VAPLMEGGNSRDCFLPAGKWIDYQSGAVYNGGWQRIKAGRIPAIILVRDGSLIPVVPVAQSTDKIEWDKMELKAYKADAEKCRGLVFKPGDSDVSEVEQ